MIELTPRGKFVGFQWRTEEQTKDIKTLIEAGIARIDYHNYGGTIFQDLIVNGMRVPLGDWVIMFPNGEIHIMRDGEVDSLFVKQLRFIMEGKNDNVRPSTR